MPRRLARDEYAANHCRTSVSETPMTLRLRPAKAAERRAAQAVTEIRWRWDGSKVESIECNALEPAGRACCEVRGDRRRGDLTEGLHPQTAICDPHHISRLPQPRQRRRSFFTQARIHLAHGSVSRIQAAKRKLAP